MKNLAVIMDCYFRRFSSKVGSTYTGEGTSLIGTKLNAINWKQKRADLFNDKIIELTAKTVEENPGGCKRRISRKEI